MKPNWLLLSNLDHDGGYLHKFPPETQVSHGFGLSLLSHFGTLLESSFQHPGHISSSGNVAFQETFYCLNKFAGAFNFWLSSALNPKIFRRLSAIAGSSSRVCQSHIKQVTSCVQNLAGLQFGSRVREDHAVQMLLVRIANSALGRLWNEVEQRHASDILTLAAATVIPPFENISPKMLAESITLGNNDSCTSGPMDQPYLEEKRLACACVAVPSIILPEDAIEPKTGIKFPTFLEDNSIPNSEVLVGMGFRGMRIMRVKNLKLYAFGLYIHPYSICKTLGPKYASVPIAELKNHPDFYEDLLRENIHMTVRLVVNCSGLSIGAVRDAFEKSLCQRLQKMNPNADYGCLETFGSYFTQDIRIPAGTTIDFRRTSDGRLITEIDGKHIGAVQSKDLCSAFFDMYIGDPPVSLEAKQDIAQNVGGLMRRC